MTERIQLDGHALRTDPTYEYLPGRDPYDHQRITDQLFDQHDQFVGMNTAPTGGGKTDSWTHGVLKNELHTIAFYPRNSLVSDQKEAIEEFAEEFYPDTDLKVLKVTSGTLAQARKDELGSPSKGKTLSLQLGRAFKSHDVVIMLTNPDIFVNMYRGMYADNNVEMKLNRFEVAVSDEFHMCKLKERNTLLFILEEMYNRDPEYTKLSKILFLSATPERSLQRKLDNHLNFNYHNIGRGGGQRPLSSVELDENWRVVMPPVNLELRQARTFSGYQQMFSDEQILDTLQFIDNGESVLVMLDGLGEVNNAYSELQERLGDHAELRRITGFHDKNKAEKLDDFDVLVSNSAVEVGIDFDIDRLLFSAPNEASFIQRLGRLRGNIQTPREAVCYVERPVLDMVANLPLDDVDGRVSRPAFEYVLRDTHQTATVPDSFSFRYSALEAYHHAMSMDGKSGNYTPDTREEYQAEALSRIKRHFFDPHGREFDKMDALRIFHNHESDLLEQLQPYRSESLQTLVYDVENGHIRTYNPISLIRNSLLEFVPEDQFYARLPDHLREEARGEELFTDGYCLYYGQRDEDADSGGVGLTPGQQLRHQIASDVEEREPIVTNGLQISVDDPGMAPGIEYLNGDLSDRQFTCYPINGGGGSHTVVTQNDLDPFFVLYPLRDVRGNMLVALGHNALYLDCHVQDALEE